MTIQTSILAVSTVLLAGLAGDLSAQTAAAQKNGWATYATQLARVTTSVNKACSTNISAAYDKSSYKQFDPVTDRTQAVCQNGVNALASICKSDSGKAAAKNITSITCRQSSAGTNVERDGEKLVINIDPKAPNIVGKKPERSYNWVTAVRESL